MLAVLVVSGVGRIVARLLKIQGAAWYWELAFVALLGQTAVNVLVESMLLCGFGSARTLRSLAWVLVVVGVAGHLFAGKVRAGSILLKLLGDNKLMAAVLLIACLTNVIAALAPSTKIDELFYHMLVPKRIVEDGGLQFYRLPIESAIVPQMHYPIALSVAHAAGAPDAGNLLSLSFSITLMLFMIGFLRDTTGNDRLAALVGTLCSVGIYVTVWHTTGGSHALGDLATVVAIAGVLRAEALMSAVGPLYYTFLLSTASALAASTKISLWPLCAIVSLLIIWKAGTQRKWLKANPVVLAAIALAPWIIMHAALMVWTYRVSGSFWGPILADFFGPSQFPRSLLALLEESRKINQTGLLPTLKFAGISLSPIFLLAVPWLFWTAWRGCRTSILATGLFLLQCVLIAWKLPHDFRFLGGLQYIVVIAAILTLSKPEGRLASFQSKWPSLAEVPAKADIVIILALAGPWLALQIYYSRPFAEVVGGLLPREQFLQRYVALARDFETLNGTLPKEAILYCDNARLPNFYAPRPVYLTLLDLHGDRPIYRLTLKPKADSEAIDARRTLNCGEMFYRNDQAVIETYRTPGKNPIVGSLKIQRCWIAPQ